MLVLTRLPDQVIVIDTGLEIIEVVVCGVRGDRVRIGIRASDDIKVCREEVYGKREKQNGR
jgi:carbon storage regulator CsrA